MNNEDRELVQQTLDGDPNGFNRLVTKYRSSVYAIAYHWTKNFAESQDLTQESFLRAYEQLDKLRDASKFGGWLQQITTNLCRLWWRGQSNVPESLDAPDNSA